VLVVLQELGHLGELLPQQRVVSFVAWMHEHQQQAIDVVVVLELCVRECIARVERVLATVAMMSAGLTHNR